MPTNEERREVARKLRNVADRLGGNMDGHEFAHYVADAVLGKECRTWNELTLTIADLIEPEPERTCTITHAVFNEGDPTGEYEAWNCSHCGELPYDDADSFSYCSCCGAKVMDNANF